MGNTQNPPQKVIHFENLTNQLTKCQQLGEKVCPTYGHLHKIRYQNTELFIGKCSPNQIPSPSSLHHIILPNILIVPKHTYLQHTKLPTSNKTNQLINLIINISTLQTEGSIGLSHGKIAFSQLVGKWCVVGDQDKALGNYQAIMKNQQKNGIYLSPQLMSALSKDKMYPKIDVKQSDVFILGIMLLQIIFEQNLQTQIYNFNNCQIKLAPILQKLLSIEQTFNKTIYDLFIQMLQFDPTNRITFQNILHQLKHNNPQTNISPSATLPKNTLITPPANTKLKIDSFTTSPQPIKYQYEEQHSRTRSPGAIRKNLPLADRQSKISFSPIRSQNQEVSLEHEKNSFGGNQERQKRVYYGGGSRITPNRVKIWEGMENQRPKVQPFGLKFEGRQNQMNRNGRQGRSEAKSFSKLRNMRF